MLTLPFADMEYSCSGLSHVGATGSEGWPRAPMPASCTTPTRQHGNGTSMNAQQ
jgi:hypothetical protein